MKSFNLFTVGSTDQRCPYCLSPLEVFPAKAIECPSCREKITPATRPKDGARVLLTEEERQFVGGRWKPVNPNEREAWIRRNPADPAERRAYFAEQRSSALSEAEAMADEGQAYIAVQTGLWSCDCARALDGIEFGRDQLPALPLAECPFAPHCFCAYVLCVHDNDPPDHRTEDERDAEFEAALSMLTPASAAEVLRLLNSARAGFGIEPYRMRRDR